MKDFFPSPATHASQSSTADLAHAEGVTADAAYLEKVPAGMHSKGIQVGSSADGAAYTEPLIAAAGAGSHQGHPYSVHFFRLTCSFLWM